MNECIETEARDALPDLSHGRLSDLDTATLTALVESCADCRAELDLLRQLRSSAPFAPSMDVARIVSSLPFPTPSAPDLVASAQSRTKSAPRHSFIWKAGSFAALLVVGSLTFANYRNASLSVSSGQHEPTAAPVVAAAPLLQAVAAVSSQPVGSQPVAATESSSAAPAKVAVSSTGLSLTGVQGLTDDQLQALVNSLDNVQGLPSAEPEAVSIGVDDNEGMQ
jgi:hypothetical protein